MTYPGFARLGPGLALVLLLLPGPPARAEPARERTRRAAAALAARIDQHLARRWKDSKVHPAPPAGDAEFLRRVYLDLIGRIPSAGEARRFLADTSPDKRQRLVEDLLDHPRYVTHWMAVWEELLLPELATQDPAKVAGFLRGGMSFQAWLYRQLQENTGYDKMVRELLTTRLDRILKAGQDVFLVEPGARTPLSFFQVAPSPQAFYVVKQARPENLAASTARLFLGLRLECAQCHDHPFASWKREQFWGQAAFFAGLEAPGEGPRSFRDNPAVRSIAIPELDKVVPARFLDGRVPRWKDNVSGRQTFADWLTSPKNPYFARAAANRLWANFVGTGLIEPVDEMVGEQTQNNDPGGLLDDLAAALVAQGFDLKFLMRAITASRAYQLSSARSHASQDDPRLFARMTVRGLTAAQLFDSLAEVTGYRLPEPLPVMPNTVGPARRPRERFLEKFAGRTEKAREAQTSIQHALALMNGDLVASATSLTRSRTLTALLDFPLMSTPERIEALYLATLSRQPTRRERERMVKYVEKAAPTGEGAALADVLWVLLNCAEFKLNH
jgi:hypothetical protein